MLAIPKSNHILMVYVMFRCCRESRIVLQTRRRQLPTDGCLHREMFIVLKVITHHQSFIIYGIQYILFRLFFQDLQTCSWIFLPRKVNKIMGMLFSAWEMKQTCNTNIGLFFAMEIIWLKGHCVVTTICASVNCKFCRIHVSYWPTFWVRSLLCAYTSEQCVLPTCMSL